MKISVIILLSLMISLNSFCQDTAWKQYAISDILSLKLPANTEHQKSTFIKEYGGYIKDVYYGVQHFDTVFRKVETDEDLRVSIGGFFEGKTKSQPFPKYNLKSQINSFGGTKGILAEFIAKDTAEAYKQVLLYITMANSHYYCFYVWNPLLNGNIDDITMFFKSINFDLKKIQEASLYNKL